MHFLGNLNVAGGRVFFELFTPSEKRNGYDSQIMELRGRDIIKYTRGGEDRDSTFDLTGKLMAYLSRDGDDTSVVAKNIETGEERKIWKSGMKIKDLAWGRKSSGLFLIAKEKVRMKITMRR